MLNDIVEAFPDEEFMVPVGFDDAVMGVDHESRRLVYSISKCIQILISQGMTMEEAAEYFDFNVSAAYVGEKTPIWVYTF